ncbi:MAG: hypothetical protein D6753_07025 [Planctomycetota bacterium]|nr:MAG: hypothetical protein D6753_07025 [Planctomycetota bacterium]
MDRATFLKIIRQTSRAASGGLLPGEAAPLAQLVRQLQHRLADWRHRIPAPPQPLPNAEQIAAFLDGATSAQEDAVIIRAAIHDPGILLQIASDVCTPPIPSNYASADLRQRLIDLAQPDRTAPPRGPSVDAWLLDASASPAAHELLRGDSAPVEPMAESCSVASAQCADSRAMPQPRRDRRSLRDVRAAPILAALVATLLIVLGGWGIWHAIRRSPLERHGQVAEQDLDGPMPAGGRATSSATIPPLLSGQSGQPSAGEAGVEDDIQAAVEELEAQLAQQSSTRPLEEAVRASFNVPPGGEDLVGQPTGDRLASPIGRPAEEPAGNPAATTEVAGTGTLDRSRRPTLASQPIRWLRVVGLLAQQPESGYDAWMPVAGSDALTELGDDPALQHSAHPDAGDWLTLPGSFAEGEIAAGGRIVLGENTNVVTRLSDDGTLDVQLRFGSAALLDLPSGTRLRLPPLSTQSAVEVVQPAELLMQRVAGGVLVQVHRGEIRLADGFARAGTSRLIHPSGVEPGPPSDTLPSWAVRLPTRSTIPRQVLANIDSKQNLPTVIDAQLVRLGRNLDTRNALAVRTFLQLCQLRARMAVADPLAAATHPIAGVRLALFDLLTQAEDNAVAQAARRELMRRLRIARQELASWSQAVTARNRLNRQFVARWLDMLIDEDPVVAAVGDYFLRRSAGGGPVFNPSADRPARMLARTQWLKLLGRSGKPMSSSGPQRAGGTTIDRGP